MFRRTPSARMFPYSTIIVGGGTSGCYLAHTLAMAGQRVALVEEGIDVTKKPRWQHEMPCGRIAHRILKSGFERRVATTPQKGYKGADIGSVEIPTPKVLGGSGVVGGRTWIHGDVSDWEGTGLDFKKDIRRALIEVEGIASPVPHRGKLGRFFLSRPQTTSPTYKAFSESIVEKKGQFVIEWNNERGVIGCGVGRPEVLIDRRKFVGHSTLRAFLTESLNLKRDVSIMAGTSAVSLRGRAGKISGVNCVGADGKEFALEGSRVILAAGPIANAQLILRSPDLATAAAAVPIGQNYFDRAQVVLQFKSHHNDTHQMFDTVLTRLWAMAEWQWKGRAGAVTSAYDDLVCYWSPDGPAARPSVRITFQPFAMDNNGVFNDSTNHAVQFVIDLLQPASRGTITADAVDPNYYAEEADRVLMAQAVDFVKSLASTTALKGYLAGEEPIAEFEQAGGDGGGSLALGSVVSEADAAYSVNGFEGLHACGSSILPRPMLGSTIATTMATAVLLGDGVLNAVDAAKPKPVPKNFHPGTVGGQDSDRAHSSKVKVTYY